MQTNANETILRGIFFDSVMDTKRTSSRPILSWLDNLEKICAENRDSDDRAGSICAVFNNFALIVLHVRGVQEAAAICEAHIRWAIRAGRGDLAVQPVINLLRISRSNRYTNLDDLFDELARSAYDRVLYFSGRKLCGVNNSDTRFLKIMYISEKFKAVLSLGSQSMLALLSEQTYQQFSRASVVLDSEQHIRAGLIYDNYENTRVHIEKLCNNNQPFTRMVGMYYAAATDALERGRLDSLVSFSDSSAVLALSLMGRDMPIDHRFGRLILSVARTTELFDPIAAQRVYQSLVQVSRRIDDVRLERFARNKSCDPDARIEKDYALYEKLHNPSKKNVKADEFFAVSRKIEILYEVLSKYMCEN